MHHPLQQFPSMKRMILPLFALLLTHACAQAQNQKVFSHRLNAGAVKQLLKAPDGKEGQTVCAYVRLTRGADKNKLTRLYGMHFNVRCGNTYTAVVPQNQLEALTHENDIEKIIIDEPAVLMTDAVRSTTHVDEIHQGTALPSSFKGSGILIGIIDTGFDFTHPNFKDASGKCRILNVWDQNGFGNTNNDYHYGTVYATPSDIANALHDNSPSTHGTHVAGIAAGSADTPYKGIAPESDIVLVSTNQSEQGIVDGVDYLIKYAQQAGRPIAINVSLGIMMGFKDGTGLMARMLDNLLENRPGCLMAVAVGNEGNRNSTLSGKDVKSVWMIPERGADQIFIEAQPDEHCEANIVLRDKTSGTVLFDRTFTTGVEKKEAFDNFGTADKEHASFIAACIKNEISGAYAITLSAGYTLQPSEEWVITLKSDKGTAKAYCNNGSFSANGKPGFVDGSTESTLAMTATGNVPIAVGAYVSKVKYTNIAGTEVVKPWILDKLYPLSAKGPTSDGRIKPDIVAPGASVVSSYNGFAAPMTIKKEDVVYGQSVEGKTYYWYVENGTSMASPVVAGIMALWLQAKPTLTQPELKELLKKTAVTEAQMEAIPNNQYGLGKINALNGLKELLSTRSVENAGPDTELGYVFDQTTGTVVAKGAAGIQLYDVNGRMVISAPGNRLHANRLPKGIYILKTMGGRETKTFKILI